MYEIDSENIFFGASFPRKNLTVRMPTYLWERNIHDIVYEDSYF